MNVRGIKYRERPLPMITRPDGRPDSRGVKPYIEADGKVIDKGGAIFNFIQASDATGRLTAPHCKSSAPSYCCCSDVLSGTGLVQSDCA